MTIQGSEAVSEMLLATRTCVFDAYGTLFDFHAPVARLASRIGEKADQVSKLWRQKQIEYTWLRSLMGIHADFWKVTDDALSYVLEAHGIADQALKKDLMELYLRVEAYPDVLQCLAALKQRGKSTAILSNGTPAMLAAAVESGGLKKLIDEVISVEGVGIFKPSPKVYDLAMRRLMIRSPSDICFVSANPWDAQAAAQFGFQTVRVDRFGLKDECIPGRPAWLIKSLMELPRMLYSNGTNT